MYTQQTAHQHELEHPEQQQGFEKNLLCGELLSNAAELENHQSEHEVESELNQLKSAAAIAPNLDETSEHLHIIVYISDQLRKVRQTPETTLILHISKP